MEALGQRSTKPAVLVGKTSSHSGVNAHGCADCDSVDWTTRALAAARPHFLRIVGSGSLGIATPSLSAYLGALACDVTTGGVAWVSSSNAMTNGVLGAHARGLGFSRIVALGDEADVDSGDILDFLASDPSTRAILLAIEGIKSARKFMSAARAAARNKPVLVLRTGRNDRFDRLYGAAFRRAGLVRADALDDL